MANPRRRRAIGDAAREHLINIAILIIFNEDTASRPFAWIVSIPHRDQSTTETVPLLSRLLFTRIFRHSRAPYTDIFGQTNESASDLLLYRGMTRLEKRGWCYFMLYSFVGHLCNIFVVIMNYSYTLLEYVDSFFDFRYALVRGSQTCVSSCVILGRYILWMDRVLMNLCLGIVERL